LTLWLCSAQIWIDCKSGVEVYKDPVIGLNFVNFSIAPNDVSVDFYEPDKRYFCNFIIDVSLRRAETVIYQYSKEYPLYFPEAEIGAVQRKGLSIEDTFPVIEGTYNLTILLRNPTNKEFSIITQYIVVPAEGGAAKLSQPIIGDRLGDHPAGTHTSFKMSDKKLNFDPKKMLSAADEVAFFFVVSDVSEELWKEGEVAVVVKGTRAQNPWQKSYSIRLDSAPQKKIMSFSQSFSAADLAPDYYDVKLTLKNGQGKVLDEQADSFVMSPEKAVPHPDSHAKSLQMGNSFVYFYMLAYQYASVGQDEKAEAAYEKAYNLNPSYKAKLPEYGNFLLKIQKFDKALILTENFKDEEKLRFENLAIKGKALMGKGDYAAAIDSLLQGNKLYNSDIGLLNALGTCFYKTGQKESALDVLNASLKLNPGQEDIKKIVQELEKK
jgi:tetratricopeptide (TPR) repeat protein